MTKVFGMDRSKFAALAIFLGISNEESSGYVGNKRETFEAPAEFVYICTYIVT